MTTKTKFKTNPIAKKIRADNLERERGTEESVKQITYWKRTGNYEMTAFDHEEEKLKEYYKGLKRGQYESLELEFLFIAKVLSVVILGLIAWIVTH